MKRRSEFLISKRDGRREHMRAAKLARSIDRALGGAAPTPWFAIEAATQILAAAAATGLPLSTRALSAAVVGWFSSVGRLDAAQRYAECGAADRRRAGLLEARAMSPGSAAPIRLSTALAVGDRGEGHGGLADPRLN